MPPLLEVFVKKLDFPCRRVEEIGLIGKCLEILIGVPIFFCEGGNVLSRGRTKQAIASKPIFAVYFFDFSHKRGVRIKF